VSDGSGRIEISDPSLVRRHTSLAPDEVDLGPGAVLLSIAEAERLARVEEPERVPGGNDEAERTRGDEATEKPPLEGRPEERSQCRVSLRINATEDDLHTLQRALTGLRDVVKPGPMRIEVTVSAEHPEAPIDSIQFQNRVRQHLEEDPDVSFSEDWE
jgi:hypothetical protein